LSFRHNTRDLHAQSQLSQIGRQRAGVNRSGSASGSGF